METPAQTWLGGAFCGGGTNGVGGPLSFLMRGGVVEVRVPFEKSLSVTHCSFMTKMFSRCNVSGGGGGCIGFPLLLLSWFGARWFGGVRGGVPFTHETRGFNSKPGSALCGRRLRSAERAGLGTAREDGADAWQRCHPEIHPLDFGEYAKGANPASQCF